jgi:WD40 repeat protein
VALSFDGTSLAAAEYGRPIRIWDLNQKRVLRELVANAVIRLAFSPDDNRLVARTGCELRVWELENPSKAVEIPAALSFAFSEAGDVAVAHDPYDGVHFHSLSDGSVVRSRQGNWPNLRVVDATDADQRLLRPHNHRRRGHAQRGLPVNVATLRGMHGDCGETWSVSLCRFNCRSVDQSVATDWPNALRGRCDRPVRRRLGRR